MPGKISKAFLLAAGLGTRLRPVTDNIPKCLVPIHGQPLLSIWLRLCEQECVREVLINTHHLAEKVREWAGNQKSNVKINLFHEEVLRGSAGTIAANRDFIGGDKNFYVFYADNLVQTNLGPLQSLHHRHSGALTMGLFRSSKPRDCGIVTLDASGKITSFEEKPANPRSNLAYSGILIARTSLLDYIPQNQFADLGKDALPKLAGDMWGQELEGYLIDIGTPENYERALTDWPVIEKSASRTQATAPS